MACESSLDSSFEFQVLILDLIVLVLPGRSQLLLFSTEEDSGMRKQAVWFLASRKVIFFLSGLWQCEDVEEGISRRKLKTQLNSMAKEQFCEGSEVHTA